MSFIPPVVNTQRQIRPYNLPLYGVKGEFSLSPTVVVPYFACLMDLRRVTSELKTHEEVSPSLDTVYSLAELYQRQIDVDRVEREIVDGYLRVPNKLKFFNSLTIALLPKDEGGKVVPSFEDYENNDPVIPDPMVGPFDDFFSEKQAGKNRAVFGGVQYVATETENLARLRWDTNRVDAVAVDGQHRLKALKMWMERKNNQLSDYEAPTRVPVLFLMLHERAGFKTAPNSTVTGIKAIAREIFTDLNKNAKEVDVATEIILDDLSVEACCVRALITPTTCTDSDELLPLSLLRWQEANTRFDQKYYLNSIVNLHLIVKELLGFKQFDAMNKSDVLDFIKSASSLLGVGEPRQLVHNGVTLENYYLQNFCEEGEEQPVAPFSAIPQHYLNAAVDGFRERFAPWLLKILTKFDPYAQILSYARSNGLLTGEFAQYLSQPRAHQFELAKDLGHKYGELWMDTVIEKHNRAIEIYKGMDGSELGEQWAFKTIFQKSLVRLARILFITSPEDQRGRLGSVDEYVDFLNRLHAAGVFRVHASLPPSKHGLWVFLAVNYGGRKIKVTATTEARIFNLLSLWYYGTRYLVEQGKTLAKATSDTTVSSKDILKYLGSNGAQIKWPKAKEHVDDLLRVFGTGANASVIAGEDLVDEEKIAKVSRARLEAVFAAGVAAVAGLDLSE